MEQKLSRRQKHSILKHPVIGAFILAFGWFLVMNLFGSMFTLFGKPVVNIATAVCACLALLIHKRWFREEYKGSFCKEGLREKAVWILIGIALITDFLLCVVPAMASGVPIGLKFGDFTAAVFAGFAEEIAFRVMMVSIIMRAASDRKHITMAFWISALVFGCVHLANVFISGDIMVTALQVVSAGTAGMFFAAVYLRTANIGISIGFHFLHDIFSAMPQSAAATAEITTTDIIITFVYSIVLAIISWCLLRGQYDNISRRWDERWSRLNG